MLKKVVNEKVGSILVIMVLVSAGLLIFMPNAYLTDQASAGSTWQQTSDTEFDNGTFENITISGAGEVAELKIDLSELHKWTQKTPSSGDPGTLAYHMMATIYGTDKVLLYYASGGSIQTWVYDVSDNTWQNQNPTASPSYRNSAVLTSIYGTDKVLLFGGYTSYPYTYLNESWTYDLSDNTWTNTSAAIIGTFPGRTNAAMANIYNDDKVIVFGGYTPYAGYVYDTWMYDLSDNRWTEMTITGSSPTIYMSKMSMIPGTSKVLLVGSNAGVLETWVYDLSLNTWTSVNPSSKPLARYYHGMAPIHGTNKVLLFGGRYGSTNYDDTWIYDSTTSSWSENTDTNKPSARGAFGLGGVDNQDRVILYGGWGGSYYGDTWVFKDFLQTKNGTYTSQAYDTKANSSFHELSWSGVVPENTYLRLQLRTASSETGLESKSFVGPDGTAGSYYISSDTPIWTGHTGDRWIQYKVYFNIDVVKESPTLKEIMISYNCLPNTIVVGPTDGTMLSNNKPIFVWTFDDFDSEQQKAFQVLIDDDPAFEDVNYDSGEQTTAEQRWEFPMGTEYKEIADGSWYWKVRTMDQDGVWTNFSAPRSVSVDTVAPGSAPTWPINNKYYDSLDTISGIAYDTGNGSGVKSIDIVLKRLDNNFYWNGSAWVPLTTWLMANGTNDWSYDTSSVYWVSGTKYNIQSRAVDNTNNIETTIGGSMFSIDQAGPSSTISHPTSGSWLSSLDAIHGRAQDIDGAGVKNVEISVKCLEIECYWDGSMWRSEEAWLKVDGTDEWAYDASTIPWVTGNEYMITARASDNVDNYEIKIKTTTFKFDNQPPTTSVNINDDEEFTNKKTVTISFESFDIGSGISEMSFSNDGNLWTSWESTSNNGTKTMELPAGDGEKFVYFRVRDTIGNIAEPIFDTIIMDTTPPDQTSIVVSGGIEHTTSNVVFLALSSADALSGVADMSFSTDGTTWTAWEPYTPSRSFTLPAGDGLKTVYFRVKDKAGNLATSEDSITLDKTPPHSLSVVINDGATETNSSIVTLKLAAIDELSGVYQISFSDDGKDWSAWESYTNQKTYTLPPENGGKTVYFKVKDKVGNIAEPVASTIILNLTSSEDTQIPTLKEETSSDLGFWLIIIIVMAIIIVLAILALIVRPKRRKDQEILPEGTLTIRPGGLSAPVISMGKVPATLKLPELPGSSLMANIDERKTAASSVAPKVPALARFTQATAQAGTGAQAQGQVILDLPQLPPAKITTTNQPKSETNAATPTPAAKPTVATAKTPTPATPATISTTATATVTSPAVSTSSSDTGSAKLQKPQIQVGTTPVPVPTVATRAAATKPTQTAAATAVKTTRNIPAQTKVTVAQPNIKPGPAVHLPGSSPSLTAGNKPTITAAPTVQNTQPKIQTNAAPTASPTSKVGTTSTQKMLKNLKNN